MRMGTLLATGLGLAAAGSIGWAQERQLGAHVHGLGTLNVALDGTRLVMELEAPGADIVGFEHPASTPEQQAALTTAQKLLAAPQALFLLPSAAGCTLTGATVKIGAEDHDHDAKEHDGADHDAKAEPAGQEHSAFQAEYSFECKAPTRLSGIGFDYFKAFAGAQRLDVTVITPKGQSQFEVSREKPSLDLGGMI